MSGIEQLIEKCVHDFCIEFVESPYLCYTEHGLHARFYSQLLAALPQDFAYFDFKGQKICAIQKEYRTREDLGKSKRQGWDIAIIDKTKICSPEDLKYDYLPLLSVVEFGLNAAETDSDSHLQDDIERLNHKDANISGKRFIVHFYRISERFSNRDFSTRSKQIINAEKIKEKLKGVNSDIDIYFGVCDMTKNDSKGLWVINKDKINTLLERKQ